MLENCPNCGQRLKPEWFRCPRCRELIPEQPPAGTVAPEPAPSSSSSSPWILGSVLAGIVVLAAVGFMMSGGGESTAKSSTDAPTPPANQSADTPIEARPIDSERLARSEASDQTRAGTAAYAQGDLPGAQAKFEAAIAANPEDADAQNNLAQVLVRQKRADEALPHLDEAIRLDPQRFAFRFNRARAYGQLNRLREAVADYQQAARLFPDDYVTQYNLGLTLMQMKRYPESVTALEQAVKLAPSEPSFLITLGTAYVGNEQPDRAKAVFERFLELAPNDPEVPRVKSLLTALAAAK
jgi:tetratricopeptide (TPR) repeat protein